MKVICGEHWRGSAVLVTAYFFTQGCPILPAALTSIAADLGVRPESVGTAVSVQSAVLFSASVAGVLRPWRGAAAANGHLPQLTPGEMLRAVFSSRVFAWLVPAMGFTTAMDLGVRTWGPVFLRQVSGADGCLSATSVVLGLSAGAIAGVLLGGPLTDRMAANRPHARLGVAVVSLGAAAAAVAAFSRAPGVAMGFASLLAVGLARGFLDAALFPAVLESVPERVRSLAMGIFFGLVYVFGSFSPSLVGWLVQADDARLAFAAVALFPLIGAVFAFGARRAAGNLVQYVAK